VESDCYLTDFHENPTSCLVAGAMSQTSR